MIHGTGIPWHHVGHRVLHHPVVAIGDVYCLHCKEWDSGAEEARYEGKVYAKKQWCRKCGTVIAYSVYDGGGTETQRRRAQAWATSREHITRELRSVSDGQVR